MYRDIVHKFLMAVVLMAAFCSCREDESTEQTGRTVVAYMMCEGLDDDIKQDIAEMVEGSNSLSPSDNMLVLVAYTNGKTQLMKVWQGKKEILKTYETDFECSDPNNMQKILNYCYSSYPAKSYGLIIGTHSDGWFVRSDTIPYKRTKNAIGKVIGTSRPININTLATVLQSQPHLNFLVFDCCNMQCIEVAWQLRKYVDNIIASPAEIPISGAPYKTMLPYLFNSTPSAAADEYWNYYAQRKDSVPISMIKTSELENLATITADMMHTFMGQYHNPDVPDMTGLIYYFLANGQPIMYDMNNFMLRYLNAADYEQWHTRFCKAVTVHHHCSTWETDCLSSENFDSFTVNDKTCGCVSMYVPYNNMMPFGDNDFNRLIRQTSWYNAVRWSDYGW